VVAMSRKASGRMSQWLQALDECLATVPKFNPVPDLLKKCGASGFLNVSMVVEHLCHPEFPDSRAAHEAAVDSHKARARLASSLRRLAVKVDKANPWYPPKHAHHHAEAAHQMRTLADLLDENLQLKPMEFNWKIESTSNLVKVHAYLVTAGIPAPVEATARFIRCAFSAHNRKIPELTAASISERIRRFRASNKAAYDKAFAWGQEQALADMKFREGERPNENHRKKLKTVGTAARLVK
jgi:hypothetical protein